MKRRLLTMFATGLSGLALLAWMAQASNPEISNFPYCICEGECCTNCFPDEAETGDAGCTSCTGGGNFKGGGRQGVGAGGGGSGGGTIQIQPYPPPPPPTSVPPSGSGRELEPGFFDVSSLRVSFHLGSAAFQDALSPSRMVIWADEPHADLATPRGLSLSAVPRIVFDDLVNSPNGLVRRVDYLDRNARTLSFICSDGVNGLPQGRHTGRAMRLFCKEQGYEVRFSSGAADLFDASVTDSNPFSLLSAARLRGGQVATLAQSSIEPILSDDGAVRQFRYPEGLADVVTIDDYSYQIRFYEPSQISAKQNGLYTFTGNPVRTIQVENPDDEVSINRLKLCETCETVTREYLYTYTAAQKRWTLTEPGRSRKVYELAGGTSSTFEKHYEIYDGDEVTGKLLSNTMEVRQQFAWGDEVISRTEDPGGFARTTLYTWHTDSKLPSYARKASEVRPDGSWTRYDYDSAGRPSRVVRSWLDAPSTAAPAEAREIEYGYTPNTAADTLLPNDHRPRLVVERILGEETRRTYHAYEMIAGALVETREECTVKGAPYAADTSLQTVTRHYPTTADPWKAGRVEKVTHPDGRVEDYLYERGVLTVAGDGASYTFTPHINGPAYRTSVTYLTSLAPADRSRALREVEITDERGLLTVDETRLWSGGQYVAVACTIHTYDAMGRQVGSRHNDNTVEQWTYNGPYVATSTSRGGIVTEYEYDAMGRLTGRTTKGKAEDFYPAQADISLNYTVDALGRVLTETYSGGALTLAATNGFDSLGRRIAATNSAGMITRWEFSPDGRIVTEHLPGGATIVRERHADGRTKRISGSGTTEATYTYGVNEDGKQWTCVYTGPAGTESPMWEKRVTDIAGRVVQTIRPAFGGDTLTSESSYNARGQLVKSTTPGQAPTLIVYDAWGEAGMSGLDMNSNDSLEPFSTDRITSNDWEYVNVNNEWWKQSRSMVLPNTGDDFTVVTRVTRVAVGGPGCACDGAKTETVDVHGNVTRSHRFYDSYDSELVLKRETLKTEYPDSATPEMVVSVNGLVQYRQSKTGVRVDFKYDDLGRPVEQSSTSDGGARCVKTFTHYNTKGQVDWISDAPGNKTWFSYDAVTGRRTEVKDALEQVTTTEYDLRGNVTHVSGATYPVSYGYDDWGRMTWMKTYRQEGGAGDTTTWDYDSATGLLVGKTYADGKGPTYSYDSYGKLETRTWARTAGGNPLTTTYTYDLAGELLGIDYSDATPDVAYTRDRLGRPVTIADGSGTRAMSYDVNSLALLAETQPAGGVSLTRTYDTKGRSGGFFLGAVATPDYEVAYGYDDTVNTGNGRLVSVTHGRDANAKVFQYGYLPGSDLIATVTHPNGVVATKAYETQRDLVDYVENKLGETVISKYDYANDAIGRRTDRTDSGTAFGQTPVANEFDYDLRSQVIGATMGVDQYGYVYDPIGNRLTSTKNQASTTYTANQLNQYTAVSGQPAPTYDDDGNMVGQAGWTYQWDTENRLIEAVQIPVQTGSKKLTFGYDYMSRRYSKKVYVYEASQYVLQSSIAFVYDGWNLIRELDAMSGNAVIRSHVWGLDLSQTLQGAGGVGGLLSSSLQSPASSLSCCYDANGNIGEYVASDGTIAAHYEYDPFGNTTASSGASPGALPHRFSTKYLDAETGMYYYGYRYYGPALGRWLSGDREGERYSVTLVATCDNDLLNCFDDDGRKKRTGSPPIRTDPGDVVPRPPTRVPIQTPKLPQTERPENEPSTGPGALAGAAVLAACKLNEKVNQQEIQRAVKACEAQGTHSDGRCKCCRVHFHEFPTPCPIVFGESRLDFRSASLYDQPCDVVERQDGARGFIVGRLPGYGVHRHEYWPW